MSFRDKYPGLKGIYEPGENKGLYRQERGCYLISRLRAMTTL